MFLQRPRQEPRAEYRQLQQGRSNPKLVQGAIESVGQSPLFNGDALTSVPPNTFIHPRLSKGGIGPNDGRSVVVAQALWKLPPGASSVEGTAFMKRHCSEASAAKPPSMTRPSKFPLRIAPRAKAVAEGARADPGIGTRRRIGKDFSNLLPVASASPEAIGTPAGIRRGGYVGLPRRVRRSRAPLSAAASHASSGSPSASSLRRTARITPWVVPMSPAASPSASRLIHGACRHMAASKACCPLSVRMTSDARR